MKSLRKIFNKKIYNIFYLDSPFSIYEVIKETFYSYEYAKKIMLAFEKDNLFIKYKDEDGILMFKHTKKSLNFRKFIEEIEVLIQ